MQTADGALPLAQRGCFQKACCLLAFCPEDSCYTEEMGTRPKLCFPSGSAGKGCVGSGLHAFRAWFMGVAWPGHLSDQRGLRWRSLARSDGRHCSQLSLREGLVPPAELVGCLRPDKNCCCPSPATPAAVFLTPLKGRARISYSSHLQVWGIFSFSSFLLRCWFSVSISETL